jgi:TetR/AcrR family transcriptional repressor of mexJK operon
MTTSLPARSVRKRNAIMSAGRQLFLTHGYRGTSVDQIAAAAEVSKQTVYKHFTDKRELLLAIVTEVLDGAVTPFLDQVSDLAQTSHLERDLARLAGSYLRSVLDESVVQLRRLVIGEANALPELAEMYYQRAPARTLRAFADIFEVLDARGLLRIVQPGLAARQFAFLVVGHAIDEALFYGGPRTLADLDVDEHVRAAIRTFFAAYRPIPEP